MRDLCIVARAEAKTSGEEQKLLAEIAAGLEVPESMVSHTLECGLDPD